MSATTTQSTTQSATQSRAKADATNLRGKDIVITGGTTGIGRVTARLLAQRGANLLFFGRHEKELNEALAEVKAVASGDSKVHALTADQSKPEEVRRVFAEVD